MRPVFVSGTITSISNKFEQAVLSEEEIKAYLIKNLIKKRILYLDSEKNGDTIYSIR